MSKLATLTLLAAALAAPSLRAEDGPWMVRLRAVQIQTANKSDAAPGLPADAIHVSNKTIPEVDFSYFFTRNFATELILTVPQEHDVTLNGTKIGTFKQLPPTLTAQWHFLPGQSVDPYLGAGLNLTLMSDVHLANGALDLDKSSTGLAAQAGVDFKVGSNCFINVDIKYMQIRSDVKAAATGAKVTAVKVDPMLYGAGIGYRF
jgi:outer membrane protein